jgi:hypothetical protein
MRSSQTRSKNRAAITLEARVMVMTSFTTMCPGAAPMERTGLQLPHDALIPTPPVADASLGPEQGLTTTADPVGETSRRGRGPAR